MTADGHIKENRKQKDKDKGSNVALFLIDYTEPVIIYP